MKKTAWTLPLALCLGFTEPALAQGAATSVQVNDEKLAATFRETHAAAERGEASAQNSLGKMYERGRGVARDYEQAAAWYRKAAEQGDAGGQYNLGAMYASGKGVARDDVQAVAWFRKAAEQGDVDAQTNLGTMYLTGRGVPQDDAEAAAWYRKAADQGDAAALMALQQMGGGDSGHPKPPQ
jgi:TPR repeat protein